VAASTRRATRSRMVAIMDATVQERYQKSNVPTGGFPIRGASPP
jgi:hypothetical protein